MNSLADFVASITGETLRNITFKLSDLAAITEFTNLFDQYRILQAELMVMPRISQTIDANVVSNPVIYTVPDYDGSAVTTLTQMLEYSNCNVHDARVPFSITIRRPRISVAAREAGSGAYTGAMSTTGWLDCSDTDVEHNGIVIGVPSQPTVTRWYLHARLHMEFRNVR